MSVMVLCPQCGVGCAVPVEQLGAVKTCPVCGGWFMPAAARREQPPLPPPPVVPPPPPPVATPPVASPVPPRPVFPAPGRSRARPATPPPAPATGPGFGWVVGAIIMAVILITKLARLGDRPDPPRFTPAPQVGGPGLIPQPVLTAAEAREKLIGSWRLTSESGRPESSDLPWEAITFLIDGTMRVSVTEATGKSAVWSGEYHVYDNLTLGITLTSPGSGPASDSRPRRMYTLRVAAVDGSVLVLTNPGTDARLEFRRARP